MNRESRAPERRPDRLPAPRPGETAGGTVPALDPADLAPWVIATLRAWPASVEDRLVAIGIGVQLHHVRLARQTRP